MKPIIATLVLLAACAGPGMTPEQIKALSESASSACVKVPGWNGAASEIHYAFFGGRSTGTAGGGGKATCGGSTVEFTNEGRLVPPPKPASAP